MIKTEICLECGIPELCGCNYSFDPDSKETFEPYYDDVIDDDDHQDNDDDDDCWSDSCDCGCCTLFVRFIYFDDDWDDYYWNDYLDD